MNILRAASDLSIKQSILTPEKIVEIASKNNIKAVAITDFMNMFAFLRFYKSCKKNNIKPILGVELLIKHEKIGDYKILAYAKSNFGLKNIFNILSLAYTKYAQESEDKTPYLPHSFLEMYNLKDIVFTNGGIDGFFGSCIRTNNKESIKEIYEQYENNVDNFYLEINRFSTNGYYSKEIINQYNSVVIDFYKNNSAKFIFTNPLLFEKIEDFESHLVRVSANKSIPLNSDIFDASVKDYFSPNMSFLNKEKLELLNSDILEIEKDFSDELVSLIDVTVETGKNYLPKFHTPNGETEEDYFIFLSKNGLKDRLVQNNISEENKQIYLDRLDFEIKTIVQMGFVGYFLIVQDFIIWAKKNDIPVGPGRGSGAGSLVAYSLGITDLNPLPYDLLFERFLNPERVSMPDFDIDFCQDRRLEVVHYVQQKYGSEAVSQIMTVGTMAPKAVIKDVARALGKPLGLANSMANKVDPMIPLIDSYNDVNNTQNGLMELVKGDDDANQIWEHSLKLEGLAKSVGKHAAGVLISPTKIIDFCPLYQIDDVPVSQLDKNDVEEVGLVKFDFLGLRNLTIVKNAIDLIKKTRNIDIKFDENFNDEKTYQLLQSGNTTGVFQLESSGMKKYIMRLKPTCFEDIIAILALYRPGPLGSGMIDSFIKRKAWERDGKISKQKYCLSKYKLYIEKLGGDFNENFLSLNNFLQEKMKEDSVANLTLEYKNSYLPTFFNLGILKIKSFEEFSVDISLEFDKLYELPDYFTKELEECLKPTYGIIVYQEQVMKISQVIAGYSLGGADLLRRCVSGNTKVSLLSDTKKIKEIYKNKEKYIGTLVNSFNEQTKKIELQPITDVFYNGFQKTYQLELEFGLKIRATKDHLFLTPNGWKNLSSLKDGNIVAVPNRDTKFKLGECVKTTLNYAIGDKIENENKIHFMGNEFLWGKVKKIIEYGFEDVYDLSVENTHNFSANGIIVHNCMGKKKPEEMAKQRDVFFEGSQKLNYDSDLAMKLFDLMESFAEYGFNKSHSAGYAVITYQTAYLKAHYPAEFMAATLQSEHEDTTKLEILIKDSYKNNIFIVPPNINVSSDEFSVNKKGQIVYGLTALKKISSSGIKEIISERTSNGDYLDINDFIQRNFFVLNKGVLESLISSGSFDNFNYNINRGKYYNSIPDILDQRKKINTKAKKVELFLQDDFIKTFKVDISKKDEMDNYSLSKLEKEYIGFELVNSAYESLKLSKEELNQNPEFKDFLNSKGEIDVSSPTVLLENIKTLNAPIIKNYLIAGEIERTPVFEDYSVKVNIKDLRNQVTCFLDRAFEFNWFKQYKEKLLEGRIVYFKAKVEVEKNDFGNKIKRISIEKFIDLVKI